MKKKKEKEEEKNRFHREYGAFSNVNYIARSIVKYEPILVFLIISAMIFEPVMNYLWTFMSKFVIDIITAKKSVKDLVIVIAVAFTVQLVFTLLREYQNSQRWWRYIRVRFGLLSLKNRRIMTTKFENLEDSDVMDCAQKAANACGGNNNGVEGMMHTIENFLTSLTVTVTGLVIMGTLSVPIMAGMVLIAVINFVIRDRVNKYTKEKIWDPMATWWRKKYYIYNTSSDFSAAKDIRMFSMKDYMIYRFKELHKTNLEANRKNQKIWWYVGLCNNILWFLAQGTLYGWLVYLIVNKSLTLGNFSLYLGTSATFFGYILSVLSNVSEIFAKSREVDDFRSFLDIDKDEDDKGIKVPKFDSYEFKFENVSFKYPKAEKYALKNLSITVKAGERLAVVGLNGAGKSTFIKLLLRLYDPTEGRILLNGTDIKEYDRNSYYDLFGAVFQDINLFAFPLSENVSMEISQKTDKDKAKEALEAAGLKEKLDSLDKGIDTEILKIIYDDGVDMSGGEKQKLALARALYKDAPVSVLDEPTSALDALAEAKLYKDFDKLIGGKTAVYISHRLSSTQFCNHVAMFKEGELVEYGTHESLLKAGGPYSEMFNVQAQYYIEGNEVSEGGEGDE